jgi:hypothetical protein
MEHKNKKLYADCDSSFYTGTLKTSGVLPEIRR